MPCTFFFRQEVGPEVQVGQEGPCTLFSPTYNGAGNMIGMPNPPVTITGSTPAWVPMTEAQWNTLTESPTGGAMHLFPPCTFFSPGR